MDLSSSEIDYLQSLKVEKLYVKFFDVDWDFNENDALPLAQVQITPEGLEDLELIPTIFITNRTLLHLPTAKIDTLAARIVARTKALMKQLPDARIQEIQLDCDWTQKTKVSYFSLLEKIQAFCGADVQLSATIRLHQLKFANRTGIPPVDRGMLMFYNMGDLERWESANSILDNSIASQYLDARNTYPLDLDIALPIFAWGVLYRKGRMTKLINNLEAKQLADTSRFEKLDNNRYEVLQSTYLNGYYLYQKDRLRLEATSYPMLKESIILLKKFMKKRYSCSFYHLDTTTIKNFPYEQLESIYLSLERDAP